MKSSGVSMKDPVKIIPIGSEVTSIKKVKTTISKVWYIWFFAGTATTSLAMVILFWHTTVFRDAILARLALKNGTQTFEWWEKPPVNPLLKIRIFNYTNVEDYEAGRAPKLITEELGPYIYREILTRVNVQLHDNGTVTYQEKTTHKWEGGRSDNDIICVPNVPLIMAVQMAKDTSDFLHQLISYGMSFTEVKSFQTLTVKEYIWGYNDTLLNNALTMMYSFGLVPYDKFGLLMARSGLSKDRLTIHTGSDDINNLGMYQSVNGIENRDVWHDRECDKVEGTDGSMFPPNLIRDPNATLSIYTRDMCRKFSVQYHSEGTSFDIPTLRYKPKKDIFTSSNTTNSCFCKKSADGELPSYPSCPPAGTFNTADCTHGVPLLMSFPHFYNGEKTLLNHVEGLNPRQELHETYVDIHPRLGVTIGGWSRLQINVQVSVLNNLSVLKTLKDGMILPLLWFELGVDNIPERVLSSLRQAYFTAGTVESSLQWGSLLCTILSMCAMAFMLKKHRDVESPKWQNNITLKTGC